MSPCLRWHRVHEDSTSWCWAIPIPVSAATLVHLTADGPVGSRRACSRLPCAAMPATRLNTQEYTEVLADCNVVYNQVERLTLAYRQGSQPAPDVIIIAAGTNDAWFKQRRPLLFSKTAEQAFVQTAFITGRKPSAILSLAESVRYGVELLMERFPKSRIILLTPMQTTKAPYSDVRRVGDVIEEVGRRMSVPVVRQDHITGVYSNRELRKPFLTSDGTHTSVEGARRNGRLLARQIEPLLF